MLYIQFFPEFEHYSQKLQNYLVTLSMLHEYMPLKSLKTFGYIPTKTAQKLVKSFESYKNLSIIEIAKDLVGIRLPLFLETEMLDYGFGEFCYDRTFLIPNRLLIQYSDDVLLEQEDYHKIYLTLFDKYKNTRLKEILEPILTKYNTKTQNRILFDNKYPIKTIIDKQAMLSLLTHHRIYDVTGYRQDIKVNLDGYCINPNLSKLLGLKQIPTLELLNLLGIDIKKLTSYMKTLKKLNYQIVLGGLGGAMSNFLYWLEEFSILTKINYVIPILHIFEYDELEMTNLFRIPLDYVSPSLMSRKGRTSKLVMASHISHCARQIKLHNHILTPTSLTGKLARNQRTIIIGSLSSTTRFDKHIFPKIIPLHSNNDVVIYRNLNSDNDTEVQNLIVESYGQIDLSYFFFNMVLMTYEIIEELVINRDCYIVSPYNPLTEIEIAKFSSANWEFKDIQKTNYCLV